MCKTAPAGHQTNPDRTGITPCIAGSSSIGGGEICSTCDEGFYSSSPGSSTCLACQAGKYANADQTECVACAAGKISGVASSSCTVCENGKFAEGEGNVECQFCNDDEVLRGSTTAGTGTKTALGCICPKGEYENHSTDSCEKVREGVKVDVEGMKVTTLDLKKGFWR